MYGLTRGTITLLAAGAAGLLIWIATQIDGASTGGYWAVYGLIAAAGLVMALSQLLGGWTKWGWPRISGSVFLLAFIPVLIAAGWIVLAAQPQGNWFRDHVLNWSHDIHILGLVRDLTDYVGVLAFGTGLVFGFTFDTTGPRPVEPEVARRPAAGAAPAVERRRTEVVHDASESKTAVNRPVVERDASGRPVEVRESGTGDEPPPEPPPRAGDPPSS